MIANKNLILVGGFNEIIELCEACEKNIVGVIDNDIDRVFSNYQLLGKDENAEELYKEYKDIPLVISPDKSSTRRRLMQYYSRIGFSFTSLVHPAAKISKYAKLGNGIVIQNSVNVSTNVRIGDFVRLNSFCNIMHDSVLGDFTTLAPNAVVLGRVKIKELCYIGANATILPNLTINRKVIVGAGAVVTKDVEANKTLVGNPAYKLPK